MDANALRMLIIADTSGAQASMSQLSTVTDRELKRAVAAVKPFADEIRKQERQMAQARATAQEWAKGHAEAAKAVSAGHAGVTKELLVLAHELSQGNVKNFGGSMLVLAERIDLLGKLATPTGIAIGGVGLAVGAVASMMAHASAEAERFSKSLAATGNYAGMTDQTMRDAMRKVAEATNSSQGTAHDALQSLVSSGRFGPHVLEEAAEAMLKLQSATGKSAEDVLSDFSRMSDGVAKWAEEHNRTMHFASAAQIEHIAQTERTKTVELAMVETLQLLNDQLPKSTGFWHDAAKGVADFFRAASDAGPIREAMATLRELQSAAFLAGKMPSPGGGAALGAADAVARDQAQAAAARARLANEGTAAHQYIENVLKQAKATSMLTEELDKFHKAAKTAADAGVAFSGADLALGEASIRKQFTPHVDKGENVYARMIAEIRAYNEATEQERTQQQKLSEAQAWAIEQHKRLEEAAKSLTAAQRSELSAAFDKAAAGREMADGFIKTMDSLRHSTEQDLATALKFSEQHAEASERVREFIEHVQAEAEATHMTAEEQRRNNEQLQLADMLRRKAVLSIDEQRAAMAQLAQAQAKSTSAQQSWAAGAQAAFRQYAEDAGNAAKQASELVTTSLHQTEDALTNLLAHGKADWKAYFQAIEEEAIRTQIVRPFLAGFSKWAGSSDNWEAVTSSAAKAVDFFPTFAQGLEYVPYDGFPAILHEGERVQSKQDVRRSDSGVTIHMGDTHLSVGAGVNAQEMNAALQAHGNAMEMRFRRLASQGRL